MHIQSPAFEAYQNIPEKYTCQGEDISPPLSFLDVPNKTKSLVLIMDDPDAPLGTFDHWLVWDISPQIKEIAENAKNFKEGTNSFRKKGYGGPCPPPGKPHRYFFKLYALDIKINLPEGAVKSQIENAIKDHILGTAELVGIYQR